MIDQSLSACICVYPGLSTLQSFKGELALTGFLNDSCSLFNKADGIIIIGCITKWGLGISSNTKILLPQNASNFLEIS